MADQTLTKLSPEQWVAAFTEANNADPELNAHGTYFTTSFMLDMETHTFVVSVYDGTITDIAVDPGPLDRPYTFAIRASAQTWREFGKPVPGPMFHGIWAASFQRDMRLEGDILVLMQNLRCVTRQIELLRLTGVPA